jgi:hypothetical protein
MVESDISINPSEVLGSNYASAIEEVLWQGVNDTAKKYNVEVGSDEFVKIYNSMKKGYDYADKHSNILAFLSLSSLESLMESNTVALISNSESPEDIKKDLITIARIFYGAVAHVMMINKAFSGKLLLNNADEAFDNIKPEEIEFVFKFERKGDEVE